MEWKYVKPLKDNSIIEDLEKTYSIEIPKFLKEVVLQNNGGRPKKTLFNTQNSKERVLQGLISFNKDDKANIFIYDGILKRGYIPFGITEFGDIVCINNKNKSVELYLHETDTFENVCDKIEIFFRTLFN